MWGGILLQTMSGTKDFPSEASIPSYPLPCASSDPVVCNPNIPGFGMSIGGNILTHMAMGYGSSSYRAGIFIAPLQEVDQDATPGYLDTLVFNNILSGTSDTAGPMLSSSAGIYNGCAGGTGYGQPNYPEGTVLCANAVDVASGNRFGADELDWRDTNGATCTTSADCTTSLFPVCTTGHCVKASLLMCTP
jgi:hypothetical protein